MRIALCVGHSILKNGSCTSADGRKFGGCQEYNWCKAFGKNVKKALEKNGHQVHLIICPEKKFGSHYQERKYKLDIINSGDYDLLIELHLNSSTKPTSEGVEVLYKSKAGKKYAEAVEKELEKVFKHRGTTKKRDNLYILNQTEPVAILIEAFFCTNKAEYKKAKGTINRTKLAKLIADGVEKAK